jgi:hypothetical protein
MRSGTLWRLLILECRCCVLLPETLARCDVELLVQVERRLLVATTEMRGR